MTFLNKLFPNVTPPPVQGDFAGGVTLPDNWTQWFNNLQQHVVGKQSLTNNATALNPDFHWYGTTRSTDGVAAKPWEVKANGLTFTATPTAYSSTTSNADTGSKQFINIDITGTFGGDFDFFQEIKNYSSRYQKQLVTMSAKFQNKGAASIPMYFYIGIDSTNSGSDDFVQTSAQFNLRPGVQQVAADFKIPPISVDNQNNTVTLKVVFPAVSAAIDFDVLYIKDEFSTTPTALQVDHTLEKFKIDNAP